MSLSRKQWITLGVLGLLVVVVWTRALFMPADRSRVGRPGPTPVGDAGSPQALRQAAAPASAPSAAGPSSGEWKENPFLADREPDRPPPTADNPEGMVLSGILWDPESPTAVVENQVVGPGESVGPWRVVEIQKDRVILSDGSSTRTLEVQ